MKIIAVLFLVLLLAYNNSYSQWTKISPKDFGKYPIYTGLQFTDNNTGFADYGTWVLKTTDSGLSWNEIYNLKYDPVTIKIFFIDQHIGFIAAGDVIEGTEFYRTTDGGNTWTNKSLGEYIYLEDMFFTDKNTGYIINGLEIFRTTNAGDDWVKSNLPSFAGTSIYFIDMLNGFICTHEGAINKTTDAGKSWNEIMTDVPQLESIFFVNSDTGYVTGSNCRILKTTNKGTSWEIIKAFHDGHHLNSIFFSDPNVGYTTDGRILLKTNNGGITWDQLILPSEFSHFAFLNFLNADTGFAANSDLGSLIKTTDGGRSWMLAYETYNKKSFNSCFIVNGTGYIAGSSGTILRSSDNFENWEKLNTGTYKDLSVVHFIDESTGYAAGHGEIIKTTDSGNSWGKINYSFAVPIVPKAFIDEKVVYGTSVVFYDLIPDNHIFRSTDGCNSWVQLDITDDINEYIVDITFTDPETVFVLSDNAIYKSTDSGSTWKKVFDSFGHGIKRLYFSNSNTGYSISFSLLLKSTDAGESWSWVWDARKDHRGYYNTIFFVTDDVGYIAGEGGSILKTFDGGNKWEYMKGGEYQVMNSMYFKNTEEGIIVGEKGLILKTTNGGGPTDVFDESELLEQNYELLQNYPNPFNPVTTISYSIPEQALVELKIFDMLGREVSTLVNKEQSSGKYNVQFDGSSLPSGIYIYSINAGNYESSRKLVLLK